MRRYSCERGWLKGMFVIMNKSHLIAGVRRMCGAFAIVALVIYLSTNAFTEATLGHSDASIGWLGVAFLLGICGYILQSLEVGRLKFYKSTLLLLSFILYFSINLMVTVPNQAYANQLLVGSTGGLLFSYVLGVVAYFGVRETLGVDNHDAGLYAGAIATVLVWLIIFYMISGYFQVSGNLQSDILLVSDNLGYQRRGNFMSLMFLISSCILVGVVQSNTLAGSLTGRLIELVTIFFYAVSVPLWLYLGQLVGSNSEVMCVVGFAIVSMAFMVCGMHSRDGAQPVTVGRLFRVGIGMGSVVVGVIVCAIWYFNVDVTRLRLLNFGNGGTTTSIATRLVLLSKDYFTQLDYSPLVGNMYVDGFTTGFGTYAHSLPLSLLTHLGILGALLFFLFFFTRLREVRHGGTWTDSFLFVAGRSRTYNLYTRAMLWAVVIMACLTAFFVWMPLWFALGLLVPPFAIGGGAMESGGRP